MGLFVAQEFVLTCGGAGAGGGPGRILDRAKGVLSLTGGWFN